MRLLASLLLFLGTINIYAIQTAKPTGAYTASVATQPAASAIVFSSVGLVSTIQMTGTVVRTVGPDQQTGSVTLQASSNGQSRVGLSLTNGTLVETQGPATAFEGQCSQTGFDGVIQAVSSNNCWRGTVWFLPQITLQAGAGWADNVPSATAVPTGNTNFHYFRRPAGTMSDQTAAFIARLSSFDLTVDTAGHPTALGFNNHPDDNSLTDIPTQVQFSDYRVVNGVTVPFRIQKFINSNLILDLQISAVQINPSLTTTGN